MLRGLNAQRPRRRLFPSSSVGERRLVVVVGTGSRQKFGGRHGTVKKGLMGGRWGGGGVVLRAEGSCS